MVITVTLNPAIDKTIYLEKLSINKVNRAKKVRYDIGGKGINVSKVLKELDVDSICTGFLGGVLEDEFKSQLDFKKIGYDFVSVEDGVRTNLKVIDETASSNTDINEPGPIIKKHELQAFLKKFTELCKRDDIVVLAGKVSDSLPSDIYKQLALIASKKGAKVIIDAEKGLLAEGIKAKPYAIKPNREELQSLVGSHLVNQADIIAAGKSIINQGVELVLISLGSEGSLLITKDNILHQPGFDVQVKSTVGAGDAMVAALVYGLLNRTSNEKTLALAHACGTATVTLEGTEACTWEDIKLYYDESIKSQEIL